jgi:methionyl-tRNA formyltransferase
MNHRVVFMGTPDFAVPALHMLINDPAYSVVGVVTQPGRPRGRGRKVQHTPVHLLAEEHGLPLIHPPSLREMETQEALAAWHPDVIVVAAFGQILPPAVLDMPPAGCINIHASLLPRWRGAAPIAAALLAGDDTTGVTIMKMDEGLDTGPVLAQASLDILPTDHRESLTARLSHLGAETLQDVLAAWLHGDITPLSQDEARATYAPQISKQQGEIDWQMSAEAIARQVRAFYPWPTAFTYWQGAPFKILEASAAEARPDAAETASRAPGSVAMEGDALLVATGDGLLRLFTVHPAGKRPLPVSDFLRGARGFVGTRLPN